MQAQDEKKKDLVKKHKEKIKALQEEMQNQVLQSKMISIEGQSSNIGAKDQAADRKNAFDQLHSHIRVENDNRSDMKGNSIETRFYLASENPQINRPIFVDEQSKLANKDH